MGVAFNCASVLMVLAWLIYSAMTIYQFSVRGKTISGGRWFVVGLLMFILLGTISNPKNDFRDTHIPIFIIVLFSTGIIVGTIRNSRRSTNQNAPTFLTDRRSALQKSANDESTGT